MDFCREHHGDRVERSNIRNGYETHCNCKSRGNKNVMYFELLSVKAINFRPAIKKGFLHNTNGVLYPNGSTEGTPPPGASFSS